MSMYMPMPLQEVPLIITHRYRVLHPLKFGRDYREHGKCPVLGWPALLGLFAPDDPYRPPAVSCERVHNKLEDVRLQQGYAHVAPPEAENAVNLYYIETGFRVMS